MIAVTLLFSNGCSTKRDVSMKKEEQEVMAKRQYTLQQLQSEYVHILRKKHRAKSISATRREFESACRKDFAEIDRYKRTLDKKAKTYNKKKHGAGADAGGTKIVKGGRWGKNRLDSVNASPSGTVYVDQKGRTIIATGKPCKPKRGETPKIKKIEVDDDFLEVPTDKDKKTIKEFY